MNDFSSCPTRTIEIGQFLRQKEANSVINIIIMTVKSLYLR